jgi:hypothetical protein
MPFNQFSGGYAPGDTLENLVAPPSQITPIGSKVLSNLTSALGGELPQDVIDQINQHAAEFGVSSGMPGSGLARYKGLRDLGLTSLARSDAATQGLLPFVTRPPYRPSVQELPTDRYGPLSKPNSAPMVTPRGGASSVPNELMKYLSGGGGRPAAPDYSSTFSSLANRFNPGTGMAPMGSGATPISPFSWNAGPLTVGGGNMFMGDPNELSPEELFAYGLDQPVSNTMAEANPWDQAVFGPEDLAQDYG